MKNAASGKDSVRSPKFKQLSIKTTHRADPPAAGVGSGAIQEVDEEDVETPRMDVSNA
jgi:hypothetical protein